MRHYPFTLAVHPDGYFSVCRIPSPPTPKGDEQLFQPYGSVAGHASLGLSVALNSRTRSRRGLKGITAHGKRMLRNASAILERHLSIKRVALITCTIPSTDPEILEVIAANAARITDSLSHKLQHRLRKRGLPQWVAGCWELQERGALHLHWILPSCSDRRRQDWVVTKAELMDMWRETLCQICPQLASANWAPSTRIEAIRKSVGRYLAKYLSKGSKEHKGSVPASWYHVSRALRQVIKESIFVQSWSSPKWAGIIDLVVSQIPVVCTKSGLRLLSLVSLPAKYGSNVCWGVSGYSLLPQSDLIDMLVSLIAPMSLHEIGMPISSIPV